MFQQYFLCMGLLASLLLVVLFLQAMVGDSLDPLSAEQIEHVRMLAATHPSVNRMVKKWVAGKKALRKHHLEKAECEARYIECRAEFQRDQRADVFARC